MSGVGALFGMVFILSFYGGTNYYIGRRLYQGLSFLFPQMNVQIFAVIFICIVLSVIVAMLLPASGIKGIRAAYGVYASLGNHDAGKTFKEMLRFLEQSNIQILNDEYVIIDERLVLLGRVDPYPIGGFGELQRKDTTEILATIDTNMPVVVMDHTPTNIEQYGRAIDLLLAGHSHRGQLWPFNFITRAIYTVDYGHYQRDAHSPHVIVTSGVGTWAMPVRIGSNNEIVSILMR